MNQKFKIIVHPLYYLIFFLSFFTGHIKDYIIYTLIILIHELGHVFAGIVLKWPILKVTIYPFGCLTTFNNKINSSLIEEFLILIFGPLFQILFYMLYPTKFHNFILLFNLLPIYPLDGSKLLLIVFNIFFSFYYSYVYVYIVSFITIIVLFFYDFNLMNIIIISYLLYDLYRYITLTKYIMYKFYYERYKYSFKYNKNHIIIGDDKYKMYKERNNYFLINEKCYKEKDFLAKMFDK